MLLYVSNVGRARAAGSFAMASGCGRRLASSGIPTLEVVEPMLDEDKLRLWPLLCPPWLPIVDARDRLFGGRTLSVRICLWNRVLVAANESPGISSFTCTVCACCRRLSSRENLREQWHWNGRSPVCFLMCRAKCSLRVKLNWHGGNSVQKNRCPFFFFDGR